MQETNNLETKQTNTNEIDLIEVFKKIWAERITIIKYIILVFAFGILFIFLAPKEYKCEMKILVESKQDNSMGGILQQLGGFAGINIGVAATDNLYTPAIYPTIIESTPFLLKVLSDSIIYNNNKIRVFDYINDNIEPSPFLYIKKYTFQLPWTIFNIFQKEAIIKDTLPIIKLDTIYIFGGNVLKAIGEIDSRLEIIEGLNNTVVITAKAQDPFVSAQLTNIVYKNLKDFIIENRTKKVKENFAFIEEQTQKAYSNYIEKQTKLASFRDKNRGIILSIIRSEEERLQGEYNLSFNLYNALLQQFEQSKIKVQESIPLYKVIEPVKVSFSPIAPKKTLILIFSFFLGGILGIGIVLLKSQKK